MKLILFVVLLTSTSVFAQIPVAKKNHIKREFFKGLFDKHFAHVKKMELILSKPIYEPESKIITFQLKKKFDFKFKPHKNYILFLDKKFREFDHEKMNANFDIGDYSHGKNWSYTFHCPVNITCEKDLLPLYYVFDFEYVTTNGVFKRQALMSFATELFVPFGKQEDDDATIMSVSAMEKSQHHANWLGGQLGTIGIGSNPLKRTDLEKMLEMDSWEITQTSSEMDLTFMHNNPSSKLAGFSSEFKLPQVLKTINIKFNLAKTREVYENHAYHDFKRVMHPYDYIKKFYESLNSTTETRKKFRSKYTKKK